MSHKTLAKLSLGLVFAAAALGLGDAAWKNSPPRSGLTSQQDIAMSKSVDVMAAEALLLGTGVLGYVGLGLIRDERKKPQQPQI